MKIIEFDAHLLPTAKRRLHHMKIYREYIAERKLVGDLAAKQYAETGKLSSPEVMEAVQRLEEHGQELQEVMQRLQSEVANSESDKA